MKTILQIPIIFKPYFKSVIWGGNKICQLKKIPQKKDKIGESWEISQLPGYDSIVADGEYKGFSLSQLIERFGKELLGEEVIEKFGRRMPLLVKIIDANDNLSVQVHPDDKLAQERHGCYGKTEMWYILSTDKDAKIYAGLKKRIRAEEYEDIVAENKFMEIVKDYDSQKENVFFLPAGTIHAIGSGNLLTEIQDSSDITYRIYDYDRKDADGKMRELNPDLAKDAIDYTSEEKCLKENHKENNGIQELVKCDHFQTYKINVKGEKLFSEKPNSFRIIICTEGKIGIRCHDGETELAEGYSALLPAKATDFTLTGDGVVLFTSMVTC